MNEYSGMPEKASALAALNALSTLLDEIGSPEWEVEETSALVSRFKEVVSNVHSRLRLAGTSFITVGWIQEIEENTQTLIGLAQSLKDSSPGVGVDLRDVNAHLDSLLQAAGALPAIPLRTTNQVVERALRQFDEQVAAERGEVSRLFNAIQSEIAESRDELERVRSDLTDYLSNQRGTIDSQIEQTSSSLSQLESRVNDAVERLERDISNNQELFRQAQENREQAFSAAQGQRDQDFHNRLNSTLEELAGFRDQAREMLEEVAGASTAAHYVGHSQQQSKTADTWRLVGVGALFVMALAAGWVFYESSRTEQVFSFAWLVARTGLLGSILIFAAYALRQSSNHRRQAENMERLANELQLLWPFMNRLPNDHREALLLQITPLYFRGQSSDDPTPNSQGMASQLLDRLRRTRVEGE